MVLVVNTANQAQVDIVELQELNVIIIIIQTLLS